jgi:hypothetical protein
MAKFVWALLCRRMIVDKATNAVSYVDAIEALAATEFPVTGVPIVVAGLWHRGDRSETTLEVRARLDDPNGVELARQSTVLKYEAEHRRGRIGMGLNDYTVVEPGRYVVVIEHREAEAWKEDARIPVDFDDARPRAQSDPAPTDNTGSSRQHVRGAAKKSGGKTAKGRQRPARRA